ncbi:hypothetical protein DR999_PMT08153 [Platysternon megacephalum]|uniref:Uncharacterized protein n=1 Tax=Platysternon megacephalum TaxID=55544 RepID=A0A4D9ESV7_9SAUR|nr:hypothetical protein DR999_PMT08153 [Platysternon megacephalum]
MTLKQGWVWPNIFIYYSYIMFFSFLHFCILVSHFTTKLYETESPQGAARDLKFTLLLPLSLSDNQIAKKVLIAYAVVKYVFLYIITLYYVPLTPDCQHFN